MPLESHITNNILDYLNSLPCCKAEKLHGNAVSSGKADINGCYKGLMFRLEVKTPDHGNKASLKQKLNLRKWYAAGALVGVVYSVDFVKRIIPPKEDSRAVRYTEPNGMVSWAKVKYERKEDDV